MFSLEFLVPYQLKVIATSFLMSTWINSFCSLGVKNAWWAMSSMILSIHS